VTSKSKKPKPIFRFNILIPQQFILPCRGASPANATKKKAWGEGGRGANCLHLVRFVWRERKHTQKCGFAFIQ
jgi:hypothetical protein